MWQAIRCLFRVCCCPLYYNLVAVALAAGVSLTFKKVNMSFESTMADDAVATALLSTAQHTTDQPVASQRLCCLWPHMVSESCYVWGCVYMFVKHGATNQHLCSCSGTVGRGRAHVRHTLQDALCTHFTLVGRRSGCKTGGCGFDRLVATSHMYARQHEPSKFILWERMDGKQTLLKWCHNVRSPFVNRSA